MCSVHRDQQRRRGQPTDQQFQAGPFDPLAKLTKIARNDRHPQQLQAIRMLRETPSDATRERGMWTADFIKALTNDEKTELAALCAALREFKVRIAARDPEQPRLLVHAVPCDSTAPITKEPDHGPERQHDQSPRWATDVSEPSAVEPAAADVGGEPAPDPAPVVTTDDAVTLPRDRWPDVGLFEHNGIVTHALGDEHAQNILTGVITFEEARDHHHTASRQDRIMVGSMTPRKGICQ